jgi:hypothetical protein
VVVHEAGLTGQLAALHSSAGLVLLLQHDHGPARVGEDVRGDEAVLPRSDHDRVRHEPEATRGRSAQAGGEKPAAGGHRD